MNNFLVFAGHNAYPCGGMSDYKGAFLTLEKAIEYIKCFNYINWWHVVNRETMEVVADHYSYKPSKSA